LLLVADPPAQQDVVLVQSTLLTAVTPGGRVAGAQVSPPSELTAIESPPPTTQ
jgi:hypothetical protein